MNAHYDIPRTSYEFSGNIFIFHCFDVGDDINLEKVRETQALVRVPFTQPKYFKNYHIPMAVELPRPHATSTCISAKLHSFGVISLVYKISFTQTLEELRTEIEKIDYEYRELSIFDAGAIFKRIKPYIKQAKFFHLRSSYVVIQVNPVATIDINSLKKEYGGIIASTLRFETKSLSEYQKNEILETAIGYYRGDLVIIDTNAAFAYDDEYDDLLHLVEFANMQQLELQFYDRVLDQQLNTAYEQEVKKLPISAYMPFIGAVKTDPIGDLGKLKVDISVITERLENSIKLAGEAYYTELYSLLNQKLDLINWKDSINHKLSIIHDISSVYQNKVDAVREDLLSMLVIVLIFIELIVGIMHYFK